MPAGVMLPSDQERQQIFYWLKQVSSYTAWNRILGYYKAWVDIVEASVREASERGWEMQFDAKGDPIGGVPVVNVYGGVSYTSYTGTSLPEADYVLILKGLAHCEEGVRRLRAGDKRVFKYDANGEFVMADRGISPWTTQLWRDELGEIAIDYEHTPYWEESKKALTQLSKAWGECSLVVIETSDPRDPATNVYGDWIIDQFKKMTFPSVLPEVPDPSESLLIATGKIIPYSGIWEPVDAPAPKGFSLFRDKSTPKGPFPVIGAMNYLHGGSPAPQASLETSDANPNVDATWRLLWRDDRYEDGSIPAEESGYVFLQPQAATEEISLAAIVPNSVLYAETGQPAPREGRWLAENDLSASVTVQFDEPLPEYQGRHVRWVLAED